MFNLGTLLTTFYGVSAATVPVFIIIFAIGNLLGPLTLDGCLTPSGASR